MIDEGLSAWWAPALAFLAGVVSCASPCVWPLLPGYLSVISGDRVADGRRRLLPMLLFIAGFMIVFTLLGAFAPIFVRLLKGSVAERVGGLIVVGFGSLMIGYAFGRGALTLYSERRPFLARIHPGTVGALPLGMAFAVGWTPCIGPILGSILAIAAAGDTTRGVTLLVSYSLGLGLPFLVLGLGIHKLMGIADAVGRHYRAIAATSGSLMILFGVLLFTGAFTRLIAPLAQRFVPSI